MGCPAWVGTRRRLSRSCKTRVYIEEEVEAVAIAAHSDVGTTVARLPQYYETTVVGHAHSARFIVVPRACIAEEILAEGPEGLARAFGVEEIARLSRPSTLPSILTVTWRLTRSVPRAMSFADDFRGYPTGDDEFDAFVEYLSFADVVPAESSPLTRRSLAALTASGTATGVYLGFFMVAGGTPLALLAVPAGVIICGAAFGISKGLEGGLESRVRSILANAGGDPDIAGAPDQPAKDRIFEEYRPDNFRGVDIMKAVRTFDPTAEDFVEWGDLSAEANDLKEAEQFYRGAAAMGGAAGARKLARLLEQQGDLEGASEASQQADELERED
jgi:hypothetical protein